MPQMEQGDLSEPTSPSGSSDGLLYDDLFPRDSYKDTIYWADLPFKQRVEWVNQQSNAEARRELKLLGSLFKADPLQPISLYFSSYVLTGMGLFVEGYTLFSVGNLTGLFADVWPACWSTFQICNSNLIASVNYLEIVGIIIGQVVVGIIGDWVGRRWGMIQDVVVMFVATILLTAMWGETMAGWVIMYGISLFVYSFGVGGEYPMTSTRAMEGHGGPTNDKLHRGRNVLMAFTMQGWGQFFNQGLLIILLLIFNGGGNPPYSETSAQWTFRVSFGVIGVLTLWLVYHRIYKLQFADQHLNIAKRQSSVTGYDVKSLKLVFTHYWHRLLATAVGWFCNDFFFYGSKIFSSVFIQIINPNSTVVAAWLWNLLSVGCALVGYYLASLLIDYKFYGRVRMQAVGFAILFVIFIIAAALFDKLQTPGPPVKVLQFMYYFAQFWSQFGPNGTTFLLAAEVYPAPVRATAHGFSAACGKLGALVPAVLYSYIGNQTKFWVGCWFGLIGLILTILFVPDTTGLDLHEQERYWLCVREGRPEDYHGIAIHPRHLSFYEHRILKRSKAYNPELDRLAKVAELRAKYEASIASDTDELTLHHNKVSENASRYFAMERSKSALELGKLANGEKSEKAESEGSDSVKSV